MVNEQPEALRLAEWIEGDMTCQGDAEIAAELRRLHESNQELLAALQAFVKTDAPDQIKSSIWKQAYTAINKAERKTT